MLHSTSYIFLAKKEAGLAVWLLRLDKMCFTVIMVLFLWTQSRFYPENVAQCTTRVRITKEIYIRSTEETLALCCR